MMGVIPQLVANSLIAGAIYSLVAIGFNLIYGATKFFNLAHGVIAALGGYTTFLLLKILNFNLPLSFIIFISVVFSGCIGFLLYKLIFDRLRQRHASNMVLLVASLGAFTAIQAVIAILFTSQFQTLSRNAGSQKIYEVFGAAITQTQVIILTLAVLVAGGLSLLLSKTKLGRAIRAISDDEEVAKIVGINTDRVIGYVFFIGSAIAGLAGILVGFDTGLEPIMGMGLLLKGVIGAIIGGVGNVFGGLLGSFLLGFAENFGIWKISGEWKDAIAFTLLIFFLLLRPQGIIKK